MTPFVRGTVKQCLECGSDFPALTRNHIFCSKTCNERSKRNQRTLEQKAKIAEMQRRWEQGNYAKIKNSQLKYNYGITLQQYEELLNKQDRKCFICERPETDFPRKLAVDHDHQTQEIRGLLCASCNKDVIGRRRDPEIYRRAALYLEQPGTGWFAPKRKRRKYRKGT